MGKPLSSTTVIFNAALVISVVSSVLSSELELLQPEDVNTNSKSNRTLKKYRSIKLALVLNCEV
jgi:hypothetical protein